MIHADREDDHDADSKDKETVDKVEDTPLSTKELETAKRVTNEQIHSGANFRNDFPNK